MSPGEPRGQAAGRLRPGSGAGDRLRPLLAADRGALVAARRRPRHRRRHRLRDLARRQPDASRRRRRIYLGQPYSASGNVALQTRADEPEHGARDRARREPVVRPRRACSARRSRAAFRGGISTQPISRATSSKNGQTRSSRSPCSRRSGAWRRARRTGSRSRSSTGRPAFANQKIANFRAQITQRRAAAIALINEALERGRPLGHRQARCSRLRLAHGSDGPAQHGAAAAPGDAGRDAEGPHGRVRAAGHGAQPAQHRRRSPR